MSKTFSLFLVAATTALIFATGETATLRGIESRKLSAAYAEAMDISTPLPEEARHLLERLLDQLDSYAEDSSDTAITTSSSSSSNSYSYSTTEISVGSADDSNDSATIGSSYGATDATITSPTVGSSDADVSVGSDTNSTSTAAIQQVDGSKAGNYEFVRFWRPWGQRCYNL